MAINPKFVATSDLEGLFRNKDSGLPLANGSLKFFRANTNIPKSVYQLSNAPLYQYIDIGTEVTLSGVGTPQNGNGDNIVVYYWPYVGDPVNNSSDQELYDVQVYDSNGVLQFTRQGWPQPIDSSGGVTPQVETPQNNQLSNSTFTNTFLNDGANTFTFTGAVNEEIAIAPDWSIVVNGTGTVTLTREAIAGSSNVPSNPPYDLLITTSAGITNCKLQQKLRTNSGLWTKTNLNDIYLSATLIAQDATGGTTPLTVAYQPTGAAAQTIFTKNATANFQFLGGTLNVPMSADGNTGDAGYVNIYVLLLESSSVRVSNINVFVNTRQPDTLKPSFDSSNRNQDYQSNYYVPRLNAKTIPSLLTGWDFPLNPFQLGVSGGIGATAAYIADQTIAFTSGGAATWSQNAITNGLSIVTPAAANSIALLQYLDGAEAKKILGTRLSANVFGYTSAGAPVILKVRLYRAPTAGNFPVIPNTIATIDSGGDVTLTAGAISDGWTEIPRSGLNTATKTMNIVTSNPNINSSANDYGFNGWELTDSGQIGDTNKFAIIVTLSSSASVTITLNSISLVPGDLPCRPALQTRDEVIRECQYYYEKSFNSLIDITSPNDPKIGCVSITTGFSFRNTDSQNYLMPAEFGFSFKTVKRTNPTLTFYSLDGVPTASQIYYIVRNGNANAVPVLGGINPQNVAISTYSQLISTHSAYLVFAVSAPLTVLSRYDARFENANFGATPNITFHYIADARLGIS